MILLWSLSIVTALATAPVSADEIPITVERLSERVLVLNTADNYVNVVLASSQGLVLVDSAVSRHVAAALRETIERELGRNDFIYVINTHHHYDHTNGNQAFPEAVIVGHERCVDSMRRFEAEKEEFIADRRERAAALESRLATLETDSEEAEQIRETLFFTNLSLEGLEDGFVVTPPEMTFSDQMTIDLGDITLQLIYFGRAHTDNDILIYVPEEGVLMVGDLFLKSRLPFFYEENDTPRWLASLSLVLDGEGPLEHVIPGHEELMTAAELRIRRDYVRDLWEGVTAAIEEGLSLEEIKERFALEARFDHLSHLTHIYNGEDYHLINIEAIWRQLQEPTVQ